jgi:hypothetical protein
MGCCFCVVILMECRISFSGVGIGTGVTILDVSVEPDKEDGTLMADMERESNGFLALRSIRHPPVL